MGALLQRLKDWWLGADRTQKMISVFGAAFLVILVVGTIMISSKTRMEPVAPGASLAEQSAIRDAVIGYGFPASFENGQVMVPAKNVAEIRAKLSQEGKISSGTPKGFELISEGGMFSTPAQEAERIKAAAQGELAKTIMKYQGIQDATVHINPGHKSAFAEESEPPTAVVTITPKPGWDLTSRDGKAISQIVQLAVSGMKPEGVSVIANTGQTLYDGMEANSGDAVATRKIEAEASESKRRERDLQRRLDQAFGAGSTIAMVQVELNMDEISSEEHTQTPTSKPISKQSTAESLSGEQGSGMGTGPSGAEANVLAAAPSANGGSNNYSSEQKDEQYGVNTATVQKKVAAGGLESLNVNVLVDTQKIQDSTTVKSFVDGLLTTANERNFRATVTEAQFSNEAAKAAEKAAGSAASANMMQQVMGFLPIVALLVVGLILAKSLGGALKQKAQPELVLAGDAGVLSLPHSAGLEALLAGSANPALPGAAAEDGELSNEALAALALVEDKAAANGGGTGGADDDDDAPAFVGQIRERIDVPLEQIRRLSKEKPEMVALLLKTWIMEDM